MMDKHEYLMESEDEAFRLDLKTDSQIVIEQARWAGIKAGMRVADIGCGAGKTTYHLHQLAKPNGQAVGVDWSQQRLNYAREHYADQGVDYVCRDFLEPLDDLGTFDFIWMRFVLEYFRAQSFEILKNVSKIIKPGGILSVFDLDSNCLRYFGFSERLQNAIRETAKAVEVNADFDPYVGVKLYTYLYDLGFQQIDVAVTPHNLIYGELKHKDAYNWAKKVEGAAKHSGYGFDEYPGGCEEFLEDFKREFASPRRFTYTPLIWVRGCKPADKGSP